MFHKEKRKKSKEKKRKERKGKERKGRERKAGLYGLTKYQSIPYTAQERVK